MAVADNLQSFLESRLLAWNSGIDLSVGSSAQVQIISPIMQRFADDPFATDITKFIVDRVTQEYPDLAADDGGALEDVLIKPLQLLLEPFKREIELTRLNQSTRNAALMSDDEAEALAANWFEARDAGDYATGLVRTYFSQPTLARVSVDKRFYTNDGLSFFPIQNYLITAQQMLFNRQGSFYFLDVMVRAEAPGTDHNVDKGAITSVDNVSGVVKVTNLSAFVSGRPREDNESFLGRVENSLTEKSLVTKRGAISRTTDLFDGVRAMQIIGAGDVGMDRDILTGTGEGFLHLAGAGTCYGDWLLTSYIGYRDDGPSDSILPQAGDTVRVHLAATPPPEGPPPAPATTTVSSVQVVSVLTSSAGHYIFLLDRSPYSGTRKVSFALFKPGYLTISDVPGGMASSITVPDNQVHLGGHTDIFVRPTEDVEIQTTLESVSDERPLAAILDLTVPDVNTNRVHSDLIDFAVVGVRIGDTLVVETGAGFAGTYRILEADGAHDLRVDTIFATASTVNLRARIVRSIRVDLIEPHIPKLPFIAGPVADLRTDVGKSDFNFGTNIQDFGVKIGDTINVLEGADAGEFTILGFNPDNSVKVDRTAVGSGAGLSYEIYTRLSGLSRPLVRLKTLEVLDATGQGTGITVPYGDAVDIRPTGSFEGAGNPLITYDKQLILFPDMVEWADGGLDADPVTLGSIDETTDARYSLGLEKADGVVRTIEHHSSNQVEKSEINVPPFVWSGKNDTLLALVSHRDNDFSTAVPGVHKTSDIAKAFVGYSLTLNDGPNQGRYLITDLRVLELWGKGDQGHRAVALVKIDPPLKINPIRTALNLINDVNGSAMWSAEQLFGFLQHAADWDNPSGFYATFLAQLRTTLAILGITFTLDSDFRAFFDPLVRTSYSVGPSAQGDLRLYFLDPVSLELYFGDDPTAFDLAADGSKRFRLNPLLPPAQIFPESSVPTAATLWNRNLGVPFEQDEHVFLTSGSSFAKRGITVGDTLEYRQAILDLPARKNMSSSWLCVTQSGSNVVQLIIPQSDGTAPANYGGADNYVPIAPDQLLFIDSGPDLGAYTIVKVVTQEWSSDPPTLVVQIDKPLTHSTEVMPVLGGDSVPPPVGDFGSEIPPFVKTGPLTFPMTLTGYAAFSISQDRGSTWSSTEVLSFSGSVYTTMADLLAAINAIPDLKVRASAIGAVLYITLTATDESWPKCRLKVVDNAPNVYADLTFTLDDTAQGYAGAFAAPGTKRLYGSTMGSFNANEWITVYAARSSGILDAGDDDAYLGTFKVMAAALDEPSDFPYLYPATTYVELDRTQNFPAGDFVMVRWIRHGIPQTTPVPETSNGGREISDQFVRFRLYDSVSKKLDVVSFPWIADATHALLDTSETQMVLSSPGIIDTGSGQRNYSHLSPYRILRPGVVRVSSTAMSVNREGALYYVDLPVVGYGPGSEMNVSPDDGFVLSGPRVLDGYVLETEEENFVFSDKERLDIILPNAVLPVGSTADLENKFNLAGQNIQITYNYAPLVDDLQSFFDSPLDRVTAANILVRHFLPAYVFLDASYVGGGTESDVAADIIDYINNVDPNVAEIRSDLVQDKIKNRGASKVDLPIVLVVLFHGTDRRIRGMRSETAIGLSSGVPLFKGTYLQTYFISGPDTSKKLTRPSGEQIFLIRS